MDGLLQGLLQIRVVFPFHQAEEKLVGLVSVLGEPVGIGKAGHSSFRVAFLAIDLAEIGPCRGPLRGQGKGCKDGMTLAD